MRNPNRGSPLNSSIDILRLPELVKGEGDYLHPEYMQLVRKGVLCLTKD